MALGPASAAGNARVTAIEAVDLRFRYGAVEALRGVSLVAFEGESVAVVGVNGAGKSTLLALLSGLVRARSGTHAVFGDRLDGRGLRHHMRSGTVLVPEGRRLITRLTVADNLLLGDSCHGWRRPSQASLAVAYDLFPELATCNDSLAGSLSGGQQQMLAIGRALVCRPKVLLLDEPSQGLAPVVQDRLIACFRQLQDSGVTLVIVEQNLGFAQQCTDRVCSLVQGANRFEGTWDQFVAGEDILQAYL